ncbi:MAG TPA: dihydrofolate reductase family protein [Solirubrobacteraceae bacterium]
MRKIVAIENVTLDGFADSQEGLGFEWTARAYDDEVDRYSNEHVRADVDTAMYGRATYLGMEGFWSKMLDSPGGTPTQRAHARWVNDVDKVVVSTTLESADWANSRLIGRNVAGDVATLKAQSGGTIAIYASPKLVHGFVDLGLIDEFRILVHPVTLGRGTPLFHDSAKLDLELLESKAFGSGAVYVRYQVLSSSEVS